MSKNALAASLFFLSLIAADSVGAQEIDPTRLKVYYSIPLDFDGKRVKSRPDVPVNFDNGKKAAVWKGISEGKDAKFTLHWGNEGDLLWVNEIQDFGVSGVKSRVTAFEKGLVNSTTFCQGKRTTVLKLSSVELNCTTSNRYTCDALFAAYGAEMKNPKSEMFGKNLKGVIDTGVKCAENIEKNECDANAKKAEDQKCRDKNLEKKCVVLADSYKNIIVLLKQEAGKTKKEIQADINRMQSKMDEAMGKWGRAVVTSLMSEKSQDAMTANLANPAEAIQVIGHINTAFDQCVKANKDLNNIKVKATAGGSSAPAKVAPQGGQK